MIDVHNEIAANTFIQQFPHKTLAETRESYGDCSVGVREKIWITVQNKCGKIEDQFDNKLSNNIFETTLNIATWLSTDDQKNVLLKLLHDNTNAVDKFLQMPIGRALEWHAFVERASRGKMIYLPVCHKTLQDHFLLVMDELSLQTCRQKIKNDIFTISLPIVRRTRLMSELRDEYRVYSFELNEQKEAMTLSLDRWLWHLQEHEKDKEIYREKDEQTLNYWMCDKEQKFFDVMNEIKAQLFRLTKEEILLLRNVMYFSFDAVIDHAALEQLVKIDQKVPFLANWYRNFYYKYRNAYSLKEAFPFLKELMQDGMRGFPLLAMPVVCVLLSTFVETTFCQKIISETVMQELLKKNEGHTLLNKVIKNSGHEELLGYCLSLINIADYMDYDWIDTIKIILPILLNLPGYYFHIKFGGSDFILAISLAAGLGTIGMWMSLGLMLYDIQAQWLLISIPILACVSVLLSYCFGSYDFPFRVKKESATFCDLPDLLKRTDIVIS